MTAAFSGVPVHVRRLGAVLLLVICLSGLVSGTTIAEESETVRIGPSTTEVTVHINYTELTSEQVSLLVPESYEPRQVRGTDAGGEISCRFIEPDSEILCTPSEHNGSYSVDIRYTMPSPARLADAGHTVHAHTKRILVPIESYSLRVVLPEGYGLIDSEQTAAYAPGSGEVGSDANGRQIYVEWQDPDTSIGDTVRYRVRYQELNVFQDIFPTSPAVLVAVMLILIAAGLSLYMRRVQSSDTVASVFPMLKDDEKDVIRYLVDHDGECGQKDLVDDLEYSKAKISRLVKDLEERNLIKKIKEGRRNRLKLKKDLGDVEFS